MHFFEDVIRSIEGTDVSGYEAAQKVMGLCASIRKRMDEKFASIEFQAEEVNIAEYMPFEDTILKRVGKRNVAEEIVVDNEYIDAMVERFRGNCVNDRQVLFFPSFHQIYES